MSKHLDVEELEMLLEAYFVQIDGTLNKLSTVCNSISPINWFCFRVIQMEFSSMQML